MLNSEDEAMKISGTYAVGEVEAKNFKEKIDSYLTEKTSKEVKRISVITQFKLGDFSHLNWLIDQILSDDKEHAVNICYLIMKIKREVINTVIIPEIIARGKTAKSLARRRFALSGRLCEQILLLEEKTKMSSFFWGLIAFKL